MVLVLGVVVAIVVAVANGRSGCGWYYEYFLCSGIYYFIVVVILFYCEFILFYCVES